MVRVIGLRVALLQAILLRLIEGRDSGDALRSAELVDRVEVGVQGVLEVFSLELGLDLLVDVQLQGVGLPVLLHIIMIGERVVLKAPGKVLVAGGYGVLEEGNVGLSLAVDRYFYSVSGRIEGEKIEEGVEISVSSPQIGGKWVYWFDTVNHSIKEGKGQSNPFLQNSVKFTLQYCLTLGQVKVKSIDVIILQDRGFLSQEGTPINGAKFINYPSGATKTGLGSSAGVIVVTVGAILRQITGSSCIRTINALSQVANLAAQNKIGSNFDISTAVHGSHLYRNVLPKTAFEVTSSLDFSKLMAMDPLVNSFPMCCRIVREGYTCMIDLRQGSNTRKMVSGFIKSLNEKEKSTILAFYEKSRYHVQAIYDIMTSQGVSDEIVEGKLRKLNGQYRNFLQYYSSITNIPVQPPQFKPFLDQLTSLDKVLYAICPGSGGYDAIFVLSTARTTQQSSHVKQKVEQILFRHGLCANVSDIRVLWGREEVNGGQLREIEEYLQ